MIFKSPDGDITLRISIIGFVDDSTCTTGATPGTTNTDLLQKTQEDAQLWHDLLWVSGGKLELPKCGYHTINYEFHQSGVPYISHSSTDGGATISLKTAQGLEIPIKAKNVYTTRKNLGHFKAPAGTSATQSMKTLEKAKEISDAISKSSISR